MPLGDCGSLGDLAQSSRPTEVSIRKVGNGFIVNVYGNGVLVANTLPEALELLRKQLE